MYNICSTNKILKVNSDNYPTLTKGERYEIYCENGGGYFVYDDNGYILGRVFRLTDDGLQCSDDCEIIDEIQGNVELETKPSQNNYSHVVSNNVFNINSVSNETIASLSKALEANSLAVLELAKHLKSDIQAPIIDFGVK